MSTTHIPEIGTPVQYPTSYGMINAKIVAEVNEAVQVDVTETFTAGATIYPKGYRFWMWMQALRTP